MAEHYSGVFSLLQPKVLNITERSKGYWPDEWRVLGK